MLLKNRFVPILLVLLIFGIGIYLAYIYTFSEGNGGEKILAAPISEDSRVAVESYIRTNISKLSTEPEVLGGKFYLTAITFVSDTMAFVEYEDGHNAFVSEVKFFLDQKGGVHIVDWKIVKKN